MQHTNTLQSFFKHLLMIDVYEEASVEDKEFLNIWIFVAKIIYKLSNPLSFLMFVNGNIIKHLL
ncbi:hypothetical protein [Inconstantimicrobium porci]|uniref:hypothetical protein n=1 Tax=Inconstantimicrobium porci TaxID=2652291 RepID=UPI002409C1E9|nr:hypothetical protein [Inconstantimicrobium porci]MDD6770638.1 hypothetical protein [Inconstantimicrobium porci]